MPKRKRRSFTQAFKLSVLDRMERCENITTLAAELGIERRMLYWWRDKYRSGGSEALRRAGRPTRLEALARQSAIPSDPPDLAAAHARIADLERELGRRASELDFFRAALRRVGG